jgi:hypothetical protein
MPEVRMQVFRSRPPAARRLVAAALLAGGARGAAAQAPPLPAGTRVRVTAPALGAAPRVASVLGYRADTLAVRPAGTGDSVVLAVGTITRLEASGGRRTRVRKGAGFGLLTGATAGALVGAATHTACTGLCFFNTSRADDAMIGGIVLGALGAVTGGVIGAVWRPERWHRILPTGRSSHLRVGPGHRGGFAVAVAF